MIWIIGGTSEAVEIVEKLRDLKGTAFLKNIIVSSVTENFKEFLKAEIKIGAMDYEKMKEFVKENSISLIADFSHPYARVVKENAIKVSKDLNIPYIRFERDTSIIPSSAILVSSYEEAMEYLKSYEGTVLFTTGANRSKDFMSVKNEISRYIFRIIPQIDSLIKINEAKVPMGDVIAMLGPFSKEMNEVMIKDFNVDLLVTKESGSRGGFLEKVEASINSNIKILVIKRPEEDEESYKSMDNVLDIISNHIKQ